MYGFVEVLGIKCCQNEIKGFRTLCAINHSMTQGSMLLVTTTSQEKKMFFFCNFFLGNVFCVLRDCQKFKFSKQTMIFSPAKTIFLKCLYCWLSGSQVLSDRSKLVNKLLQAIIFHLITQNWLKTSIGCILNISIPVPYSLSMPVSTINIIGNFIVLKSNSPVPELSFDIFVLQHLTCFLAGRD